ncbi:unnamed protein product [Paramecium pentaurelia]|uniref:Uncharacterized protein n=1 Tax=Paramecium pentaurelia TaxID=43138 RepID=A0A8S1U010_9CILI|nr:unnamed protein product [Paramecium pentaurelia]
MIYQKVAFQNQIHKEIKINKWDQIQLQIAKISIDILYTQDNKILYLQNGEILRNEFLYDDQQDPDLLISMKQIKNLQWQGKIEKNKKKMGKWMAVWNGEALIDFCGYYELGLKQGLWKELNKNYWSQAKISESGEYFNNQKIGAWIYLYENKKIGGGSYNSQGLKHGKWIDLCDWFYDYSQITFQGEYKNGKKIGQWDFYWNWNQKNRQIGGGYYGDDEIKTGRWIELNDSFSWVSQVTYNGEYKNGIKVGRWDIWYKKNYGTNQNIQLQNYMIRYYVQIFSGGGLYDEGNKKGRWIEISDNFDGGQQMTYNGEYKQGKKVCQWDILWNFYHQQYRLMGGGLHDNGIKIGKWVEISQGFKMSSQITYIGEYKNGSKFGRWDTYWDWNKNFQIGGGSYDNAGYGLKIGKWVDLSDEYEGVQQVIYNGEYQNGQKVGRLQKILCKICKIQYYAYKYFSGGGLFDEGIKIGRWQDLSDGFRIVSQITYDGQYQNGKKVGRWDIYWRHQKENKQIGGGSYDEEGVKAGQWIELIEGFQNAIQITYQGEYKNGNKVGRWQFLWNNNGENKQIGGGSYGEKGDGVKVGKWVDLCEGFWNSKQIAYKGKYQNGKKVDKWVELRREWNQNEFQKIGELKYYS